MTAVASYVVMPGHSRPKDGVAWSQIFSETVTV
jgi:hypothetical protein